MTFTSRQAHKVSVKKIIPDSAHASRKSGNANFRIPSSESTEKADI